MQDSTRRVSQTLVNFSGHERETNRSGWLLERKQPAEKLSRIRGLGK